MTNLPNSLPDIRNMTLSQCEAFVSDLGSARYRASQILRWIHAHGARSFEEMTNLSKEFRQKMACRARIGKLDIAAVQRAEDGTRKVIFRLEDANRIESVLIPGKNHFTACLSTQVGCRMGCAFCLTGKNGYQRNLHTGEIVAQASELIRNNPHIDVRNIVMMGMGEPLDNFENLVSALEIITSAYGMGFAARKITVSTCGIIPNISRLGTALAVNLAVSLNAADEKTRTLLMPINKRFPLGDLLATCRSYPMPARRRVTFEYVLIAGVNDSLQDARKLVDLLKGLPCKLNLIVWNAFPGAPFSPTSLENAESFQRELINHHLTAIIRTSRGREIMAACGQLGDAGVWQSTNAGSKANY